MDEVGSSGRDSARWHVAGRVQGVGFRWFVQELAGRHGIRGDVRNLPDGRVEIRAVGRVQSLATFVSAVRQGPPGARVDAVERSELDPSLTFTGFDIRR